LKKFQFGKKSETLASCNMPFRGHNENIDSKNPGMFLSIINLLSKYDPVLRNLLENRTKKSVTFIKTQIFKMKYVINLLANSVQQELINKSSFYSIIIDSTQDIFKVDQLSLTFRYVEIVHSNNVVTHITINESFLEFIPVENQTANTISNKITSSLNNY
jgi:hypothetical protein